MREPDSAGGFAGESPARGEGSQPVPLLALAHRCHHCDSAIEHPVGRRAATVVCLSCNYKTSVYAVLHLCPSCGRLLESPSRSSGEVTPCPACTNPVRVPSDVLRKEPPVSRDEFWFGCYCPSCWGVLAARKGDVGSYAVCPRCLVPFLVPPAGHYLEGGPARPTPVEPLRAGEGIVCRGCQTRFKKAAVCPRCGTQAHPPDLW